MDNIQVIQNYIYSSYHGMYRPAGGAFPYPFLTPGSAQYEDVLWDWDSWLSDIALRQILLDTADHEEKKRALEYERGCIQNFLSFCGTDGWIPVFVGRNFEKDKLKPSDIYSTNMHKPCLAQHAAFLIQADDDAEWLRESFYFLQCFVNCYRNHHRHIQTGLYYWQDDFAIGVDNAPCTFFRPRKSSGSIFLNCMMYKELKAMDFISRKLNLTETAESYRNMASQLKEAINQHCWDERDGFYYSVDLNLMPVDHSVQLHSGQPRDWDCLIQRIGVWSGFLPLWAEAASQEQAEMIVRQHFHDSRTFHANYGIRSLSKLEKMYNTRASGNPSNWLGPVWGITNYLVYKGLLNYGFKNEAAEIAEKTIRLFAQDICKTGCMHEYYEPDNGEPVLNPGFQNWNMLVLNIIAWLEGKPYISEL